MKRKIVTGVVCILLIGGLEYYVFSKQNTNKEEGKIEIDETKYEGYTFYDVEPKETKTGEIVYDIDDYVTYSNDKKIEVNTYLDCNEDGTSCEFSEEKGEKHTYSIENGKVKYKTNNGQNYTFKKINNAISIQYHTDGMDATNITIEVLANTGDVYTIRDYFYPRRIKNEDDVIKYSNVGNFQIEKMGITDSFEVPRTTFMPEVILKTTNGKYLRLNEEEHAIIESNEFYSLGIVVNRDGTTGMVDETGIVLSAFMNVSANHPEMQNSYLLTREGYLYEFNEWKESNVARKYAKKRVVKIGSSKDKKVVIFFEDGEELQREDYDLINLEKLEREGN